VIAIRKGLFLFASTLSRDVEECHCVAMGADSTRVRSAHITLRFSAKPNPAAACFTRAAFAILKKCAASVNMEYGIMPKDIGALPHAGRLGLREGCPRKRASSAYGDQV
jgi:hypothetical protein